jgi:hypothetical protein
MSSQIRGKKEAVFLKDWSLPSLFGITFLLVVTLAGLGQAAPEPVGKFTRTEGQVDVLRGGALPALAVKANDPIYPRDVVRTKTGATTEILFVNKNVLKIAQRSRIDISEYVGQGEAQKGVIRLTRGMVRAVVDKEVTKQISGSPGSNRFEIQTQNAVAGVRGSDYVVFQEDSTTGILVHEGLIRTFNPLYPEAVVMVAAGYTALVPWNRPVQPPREATDVLKNKIDKNFKILDKKSEKQPEIVPTAPGYGGLSNKYGEPSGPGETGGKTTYSSSEATNVGNIYAPQPFSEYLSSTLRREAPPPVIEPPAPPPPPPPPPPPVEVGRTTLSGLLVVGPQGANNSISLSMNNVTFLAPSTGQRPTIWNTGSITGNYAFGTYLNNTNITSPANTIYLTNGRGLGTDFQFLQWNPNTRRWEAAVRNGQGNLSGGSYNGPVNFSGTASGTIGTGNLSGSGSGTAR